MCIEDSKLRPYAPGPKYHHEALNGAGYPDGLTKKDIPFEGQIIRVADEFDAIASKRQYKSHVGISDTLKILIDETQPDVRKINPIIVKALFKVVIDDINYEISGIFDYTKYLDTQIKRLEKINSYNSKREKAKKEKKKEYFASCMQLMFEDGENFDNYKYVLEEYKTAYLKRKEVINNLFDEIKIIKRLRVFS